MKKQTRKLIGIIFIGIVMIAGTGCQTDAMEPDDQVYTLVIGIDKGVSNKIRLTVQFPTYKSSGGGTSPQQKKGSGGEGESEVSGTIVQTVEAATVPEGINLLNTATSRKISLVHAKAIILSEALAREGVGPYMQVIARYREGRRVMQVIVCKDSVEDFIKENATLVGESMAKAMELMETQSDFTGYFPRVSFQTFYKKLLSSYEQPYAIYAGTNDFKNLQEENSKIKSPLKVQRGMQPGEEPRKGGRNIEYAGTAVFNGQKMVGSLDSEETRYFLMVIGEFKRAALTINDDYSPGEAIPLDIRLGRKPKIRAYFKKGKPVINVELNIEADIGAVQSRISYEGPENIQKLNNMLKKNIEKGVRDVIKKAQKEWNVDIFTFGRKIAHSFGTIQEFEKYGWLDKFDDAGINVSVRANTRRSGLMYESAPVRNNTGKESIGGGKK